MDKLVPIAVAQAFGLLTGLGVVTFVRPDTTGGAVLLIVVTVAFFNAAYQAVRFIAGWRKPTPPAPPPPSFFS
jgi:hypothetical protein